MYFFEVMSIEGVFHEGRNDDVLDDTLGPKHEYVTEKRERRVRGAPQVPTEKQQAVSTSTPAPFSLSLPSRLCFIR